MNAAMVDVVMKLITLTAALAMQTKIKCYRKTAQRMRMLISSCW